MAGLCEGGNEPPGSLKANRPLAPTQELILHAGLEPDSGDIKLIYVYKNHTQSRMLLEALAQLLMSTNSESCPQVSEEGEFSDYAEDAPYFPTQKELNDIIRDLG
ncbi:hypothetical protein ANN_14078 [Periplaneta americana]|uniref:Uncharacterized protein n=1 Tax=Periplaneta americana TaxID=6978 RepID=A0ABQ8SWB7_PERAM|nr:hypothetical protein ANN_14078 [Periplaneta americana]